MFESNFFTSTYAYAWNLGYSVSNIQAFVGVNTIHIFMPYSIPSLSYYTMSIFNI